MLCFVNQPFDLVQINQLLLPFLKLSEATGGVVLKVAHAKIYSLYYHIMIHYYDAAYWELLKGCGKQTRRSLDAGAML